MHPSTPTSLKEHARVLVLDANQRSALAVTRSLGRLGIYIATADQTPTALAGKSHYSKAYFQAPSPAEEPQHFQRWLKETVERHNIDWVFPTTEISSQLILAAPQFLGAANIPFAPLSTVMHLADKWELVKLARQTGVPHPKSTYYENGVSLEQGAGPELTYPVVLKPTQSRRWLGDRWLNTAVHIAHSAVELRKLIHERSYFRDHPFMLQEYIEGHGSGVFALYHKGKPVTFFAHKRLREKPPQGGVSVLSESAELDPGALRYTQALLNNVEWHGVAMVEFRVARDGTPYLMEVNTRFWGSLQLAIDVGVDFPAMLYRISQGETVQPISHYKTGQRLRWVLGDIDSLYLFIRSKDFTKKQKLLRLIQFLTPHPLITRHEVNRWGDLGPAWLELKTYLKALGRYN